MNEYTINQDQKNYAKGCERNILETPIGKIYIGKLEARYESLIDERMEEEFSEN